METVTKARTEKAHLLATVDRLQAELLRQGDKHLAKNRTCDNGEAILAILEYLVPQLKKHFYFDKKLFTKIVRKSPSKEPAVDSMEWQHGELRKLVNSYLREFPEAKGRPTVWMIVALPRFLQMLRGHLEREEEEVLCPAQSMEFPEAADLGTAD